jgi:hypothetical protein
MNIPAEVQKLELPLGEYAVVGSGPLAVRGIREAHDIDLVVTPQLYDQLKKDGWDEEHIPDSKREWVLSHGPFDVAATWSVEGYEPEVPQLIADAELIDGVAFVRLEDVMRWKKACAREKDLADIRLIEQFLAHRAD